MIQQSPSVTDEYKSLEKGKNIRTIWSIKRKKKETKNRIFFNSLLQTTLNPYLQACFSKTIKFKTKSSQEIKKKISTVESEKK